MICSKCDETFALAAAAPMASAGPTSPQLPDVIDLSIPDHRRAYRGWVLPVHPGTSVPVKDRIVRIDLRSGVALVHPVREVPGNGEIPDHVRYRSSSGELLAPIEVLLDVDLINVKTGELLAAVRYSRAVTCAGPPSEAGEASTDA